jgi:hypothetical protein
VDEAGVSPRSDSRPSLVKQIKGIGGIFRDENLPRVSESCEVLVVKRDQ